MVREKEIECQIIMATVADDASGIHVRGTTDDGELNIGFISAKEFTFPAGSNKRKELEITANLLNGFRTLPDGSISPLLDFKPRRWRLVTKTSR